MASNKNVLLIAPQYFGYDELLSDYLQDIGVDVDLLPDRPVQNNVGKALIRLRRDVALPFADRFFKSSVSEIGRSGYDAILVIQGEGLSPGILRWLRSEYPEAQIAWYLWDSFENKPALRENLPLFDAVYSFDPRDAMNYGLKLRPLFYAPDYSNVQRQNPKYDICFIGTGHADRFPIVSELKRRFHDQRSFYSFLYMQSSAMYMLRRVFDRRLKGARQHDFSFVKMPRSEVRTIIEQSRIILDIQHPGQRGLTMRTLEALGARKKLATTNLHVRDYDFYDPNNIHIMDRDSPDIPENFFASEYRQLASEVYEKYSMPEFLKSLLGKDFFH